MVCCGRRMAVAADGFVIMSAAQALVTALGGCGFAVFLDNSVRQGCDDTAQAVALTGGLVFTWIAVLFHVALVTTSSRGAISDDDKTVRRCVPRLFIASLFNMLLLLPFLGISSALAFSEARPPGCALGSGDAPPSLLGFVRFSFVALWIMVLLRAIRSMWALCWSVGAPATSQESNQEGLVPPSGMWACLLNTFLRFACTSKVASGAMANDLLQMLQTTLTGVDLVPSDVTAGWKLLVPYHKHARLLLSQTPSDPSPAHRRSSLPYGAQAAQSLVGQADIETLRSLRHFQQFSMAAYGWMLLAWTNTCTFPCRLGRHCCAAWSSHAERRGDPLRCNLSAAEDWVPVPASDVLSVQAAGGVCRAVYLVAVDRQRKTVIVAIRGTLSFKDVVTDGLATPVEVEIPAHGQAWVHRGFWETAQSLFNDLMDNGHLQQLLAAADCADYSASVVGHSLGAGVGVLLACLLRGTERWHDTVAWLYASPPSMDAAAADFCNTFTTTALLGSDIITRLSVRSVLRLRQELLWAVRSSKEPKYKTLLGISSATPWWEHAGPMPCLPPGLDPGAHQALYPPGRILQWMKFGEKHRHLCQSWRPKQYLREQEVRKAAASPRCQRSGLGPLPTPLTPIACRLSCPCREQPRQYRPFWVARESFDRIWLSGNAFNNHVPDRLQFVMQSYQ